MESLPPPPRLSERPGGSAAERVGRAALLAVLASGVLIVAATALAATYYLASRGGGGLPYASLTGRAYAVCLVVAFVGGIAGVTSGSRDGRRAGWCSAGVGGLAFVLPRLLNALFS